MDDIDYDKQAAQYADLIKNHAKIRQTSFSISTHDKRIAEALVCAVDHLQRMIGKRIDTNFGPNYGPHDAIDDINAIIFGTQGGHVDA